MYAIINKGEKTAIKKYFKSIGLTVTITKDKAIVKKDNKEIDQLTKTIDEYSFRLVKPVKLIATEHIIIKSPVFNGKKEVILPRNTLLILNERKSHYSFLYEGIHCWLPRFLFDNFASLKQVVTLIPQNTKFYIEI